MAEKLIKYYCERCGTLLCTDSVKPRNTICKMCEDKLCYGIDKKKRYYTKKKR